MYAILLIAAAACSTPSGTKVPLTVSPQKPTVVTTSAVSAQPTPRTIALSQENTPGSGPAADANLPLVSISEIYASVLNEAARTATEPATIAAIQAAFPDGKLVAQDTNHDGRDDNNTVTVRTTSGTWCLTIPDPKMKHAANTAEGACPGDMVNQ